MKRFVRPERRGFSLIEVVLALGIAAFVLTGLLAMFPAGLGAESESQHESRATQFAALVFAALQSAPFQDVPCFGERLDLSRSDSGAAGEVALELFGAVSPTGEVEIRSDSEADYRIRFHFAPRRRSGRVEANYVTLTVTPRNQPKRAFYFTTVVGNFGS